MVHSANGTLPYLAAAAAALGAQAHDYIGTYLGEGSALNVQ